MLISAAPGESPLSKCPIRSRRNRSATRIRGRIKNQRTMKKVTVTINTTVARIHQKLRRQRS